MSIKPDWWIREAAARGMIEPFTDRLVREGVISYGLSSFGYDLRAAPEWRIFVNAFNTVVDPKHFDPRSLVEFDGAECIIPPNSFVLTRSIEYLRIPDDIMVVALGKSSYARCFRGDTRVALVDGTSATLEEMAHRHAAGERFFGYSIEQHGRIIVSYLDAPRFIGRDTLLEITLDNGERVHCTPDHHFMTRDGRLVEAASLRPNDSLMPLYRELFRGYEMTYQPLTGYYYPTHRLADEWNLRNGIYHRSVFRRFPEVIRSFKGQAGSRNHKVVSSKILRGEHDVYCLTVPEAGNFALEAGVFVQNCGIVANVTPLEPGWEGHVTLELSNTTPLPAKVYAHEGIVQLLFFQGERPEVTYAERQGKYQGQRGVTLPKL
jgi:deoxycytidine triphosphate deaminase